MSTGSGPAMRIDPVATHPAANPAYGMRPVPAGQRYFRLRLPGQVRPSSSRPRRRIHITDHLGPKRSIRVHVRLSEQEAQRLAEMLQRGNAPAVLAWLKHRYHRVLPAVMTTHVLRRGPVLFGAPVSQAGAVRYALAVNERMTQAIASFLRHHRARLSAAVQSPAQGVTLTFSFPLGHADGRHGHVAVPHVTVRPGYHDGPYATVRRHQESENLDGEYGS
jgi:hypothetical protein